ncbi:zinc finger BED domain-containing protein RICESLEEPER 3-like [Hevea brasiliensis]|uniref:zinc finger BED domain-containing protein RICESLEEPER 3-like n=1 Tax=Hevea brasiliensis TaxID=3981 RepID=UPI000B78D519|nr:zinc finger BED domain-containing protein RICESLEEPER 3-like [Hevea brasiliensis]
MDSFSGQEDPRTKSIADSNQSEVETGDASKSKSKEVVKRKPVRPRSPVWDHFTKFINTKGKIKGKCNYCGKEFCCDPKKNGTTALRNHMNTCKKHPHAIKNKRTKLALQPNSFDEVLGDVSTLSTWKYDDDAVREALVQMIIIDELSFRYVDGEGFRRFMRAICPRLRFPLVGLFHGIVIKCLLRKGQD